jgi:phosphotriesterase-related protein
MMHRREMLRRASVACAALALVPASRRSQADDAKSGPVIRTVLGAIAPARLGVTLMHEHAPLVDWAELYEMPPGDLRPVRDEMLVHSARLLDAFAGTLGDYGGQGAIVECTPIRVGRYPDLLVELAKRTRVHVIACTGFWCEAMAPQHPWVVRLMADSQAVKKLAAVYVREIGQGMEDPSGAWGERFTDVKAGIIKCATSKYLRPSERRCHEAAAIASRETGCPITTHTTDGGGLDQAQLLLKHRVRPERVIVGHQGNLDDRENADAGAFHRQIAGLGCYVQFDRVGHEHYEPEKTARQMKRLIDAGFVKQILAAHDHVPYFYQPHAPGIREQGWKVKESDYTVVTTKLVAALKHDGVKPDDIRTILVDNPARALAF